MDAEPVTTEEALLDRIRQRLRSPLAEAPITPIPPRPSPPRDDSPEALDAELAVMAAAADVAGMPLRSYRKVFGRPLTFARKLVQKLVRGTVEQQVSYNAANHRLVCALRRELRVVQDA